MRARARERVYACVRVHEPKQIDTLIWRADHCMHDCLQEFWEEAMTGTIKSSRMKEGRGLKGRKREGGWE